MFEVLADAFSEVRFVDESCVDVPCDEAVFGFHELEAEEEEGRRIRSRLARAGLRRCEEEEDQGQCTFGEKGSRSRT